MNLKKSETVPLQKIVFIGDLLDFSSGFPTQERFAAIPDKIFKVMRHKAASLKLLHSLMGSIASTNDFAVWSVSCQVFAVVDQPTRLS